MRFSTPLVILLLTFLSFKVQAQEEFTYYYFPVTVINSAGNNQTYLQIDYGTELSIKQGDAVSVWGQYYDSIPEHNYYELANGTVESVGDSHAKLLVQQNYPIYKNDMVAIYLPSNPVDEDLFNMARFRIDFVNKSKAPFYAFNALYQNKNLAFYNEIIDDMLIDIKNTAEFARPYMDDTPITDGLFAGSTMLNNMDSVTERNLRSFLRFVNEQPGRYMGKTWSIAETYATWLLSNSPLNDKDLLAYYQEALIKNNVGVFVKNFAYYLTDEQTIISWSKEAYFLAQDGDFKKANSLIDKVILLTNALENNSFKGWAHYYKGQIFDIQSNSKRSQEEFDKSISFFNNSKNNKGLGLSHLSSGDIFLAASSYDSALLLYRKGQYYLSKYCSLFPNDSYPKSEWARSQYLVGISHFNLAAYDSSIFYFNKMHKMYTDIEDTNNVWIAIENLADAYANKGDCDKAAELNKQRIAYYKTTNDQIRIADAYFDIGYNYFGHCSLYELAISYYELSYDAHLAINDTTTAIISRSNIGQAYWSMRELDKAIEQHKMAIALAEKSGNTKQHISSLSKLADLYKANGNPKKGLEALEEINALLKQTNAVAELAYNYRLVADLYKEAKEYIKATEYYDLAIDISQKMKDSTAIAETYYTQADLFLQQSKYDQSLAYYLKSLRISEGQNDTKNVIYSLANIGHIYSLQNQFNKADSIFSITLEMSHSVNNKYIFAYTSNKLADASVRQRDYEKAHFYFNQAFELYTELEDKMAQSAVLQSTATLLMNEGKFVEAEKKLYEAKEIAVKNNDRNNIASCLFLLSDMQARIYGEFDKAWENQMEANKLYEEIDNTWGIAVAYLNMGNIYNVKGDYENAINYYQKSDSLYKALNSEYNRAVIKNNIGTIYFWQGNYEKALPQFLAAIKTLDNLGVEDASRSLYVGNVGEVYFEQGKYKLAEKWLNQAIEESREINDAGVLTTNLIILGEVKINQKQYPEAEKLLLEAYEIIKAKSIRISLISCEVNLAKLYFNTTEYPKATQFLNEAIASSLKLGSNKKLWEAYYYQGVIAKMEGQLKDSKEALINAIETLEDIQSKITGGAEAKKIFSSGEKQIMIYSTLVDVLIELGEVDLALQYLERNNVEALRNKFNQLSIQFTNKKANETLKKERELKQKLDNLDKTLATEKASSKTVVIEKIEKLEKNRSIAENEYLKFVNQTINTNPELARHFSGGFHPRKLKTDKNRKLIPEELIVLSYLPADDKLYIFAATSDTVIAKVVNVGLQELDRNIKFIYNFTSKHVSGHKTDALRMARGDNPEPLPTNFNKSESNYKKISEELYSWLIAPVQSEIDKKNLIAVIPTGVLHFLPFQLLGETLPNGKFDYLIEHNTLFYSHTLEMLYQQSNSPAEISILAFGNADNTLPSSEVEVNDLLAIYPNTEVLIGEKATENRVKKFEGDHNVLHFATHGNLDYYDYNKSYLTLAPNAANHEDGKLTIEEVWEIEDIYSYQLVTLSACSTALSNDVSTGWAVSPASSFIDAGTPTVVASLWAVNDASTALLMKYFYENMKTMHKVDALRQAQIKLSNNPEYSHPYYWSPFILIGNWK